jgi:hypothetical protein
MGMLTAFYAELSRHYQDSVTRSMRRNLRSALLSSEYTLLHSVPGCISIGCLPVPICMLTAR